MAWDDDPNELTPLTCAACKGDWHLTREEPQTGTYHTIICRWCTHGMMTPKQFKTWISWSQQSQKRKNVK